MCGGGGDGPGCPLWIVSFADMISNLVIFFILLATFSSKEAGVSRGGAAALDKDIGVFGAPGQTARPNMVGTMPRAKGRLGEHGPESPSKRHEEDLRRGLEKLVQSAEYDVKPDIEHLDDRATRITFPGDAMFAAGSNELLPGQADRLEEIGNFYRGEGCDFTIVAFTDDRTWKFSPFSSPLELTRMMALRVAQVFADRSAVPRPRIGITPRGATQPRASNDSSAGRADNRRIEVIIKKEL